MLFTTLLVTVVMITLLYYMDKHFNQQESIDSFNSGNVEGFNRIYRALGHALFQYVYHKLGNKEEAEDIITASFIKLWQNRGKFENINKVRSYLYIVASNACIDYIRRIHKSSMHQKEAMEELIRLQEQETWPQEDPFTDIWPMAHIYKQIEKLPERSRIVFKMSFIQDLANTEIAQRLGISEKSVRNLKSAAKMKLRLFFKGKRLIVTGLVLSIGLCC